MVDLAWRPLARPRGPEAAATRTEPGGQAKPPSLVFRYAPSDAAGQVIEPYAMLVHKAKASAARVGSFTLAGLAQRGLRPWLPINLNVGSGDTGWIHPLFAEYTAWPARGVPVVSNPFLDPSALDGLIRLREFLLGRCNTALARSSDDVLSALLDAGQPQTLAAYCNPLSLAAAMRALGDSSSGFEVVSLQQFLGLSSPSLFRAAAIEAQGPDDAAVLPFQAVRAGSHIFAELPHDACFYARLPQLSWMADTPLMATFALNLLQTGTEGRAACGSASCVYAAAAAAHYDLAKRMHRAPVPGGR